MSKSTKALRLNFDDDYDDNEETTQEKKKRQKLQERRLAKFEKSWQQEDAIDNV